MKTRIVKTACMVWKASISIGLSGALLATPAFAAEIQAVDSRAVDATMATVNPTQNELDERAEIQASVVEQPATDATAVLETIPNASELVETEERALGVDAKSTLATNGWITDPATGTRGWYEDGQLVRNREFQDPADGSWYFAQSDGTLAHGVIWVANDGGKWTYYDVVTGKRAQGERYLSYDRDHTGWYHFDEATGAMSHGVTWIASNGGKWVYYDIYTGQMRYGELFLSYDAEHTGWYSFDRATGAMQYGDIYQPSSGGKWVHYDVYTGKMVYGLQKIDGAHYYFDPVTGAMAHGTTWVPEWNKWQYFHIYTGRSESGPNWIDWRAPSGNGAYPNLHAIKNLNVYVSLSNQVTLIRSGNKVVYAMISSTGLNDSTPHGSYRVTGRGWSFYNSSERMGGNYYVQFLGDYLFHSVPTDAQGNYIESEALKLGQPASHGCVRLTVSDAKWLYDNLPNGTPVYIG